MTLIFRHLDKLLTVCNDKRVQLQTCLNYENNQLSVWDNYQSLVLKIDVQNGSVLLK